MNELYNKLNNQYIKINANSITILNKETLKTSGVIRNISNMNTIKTIPRQHFNIIQLFKKVNVDARNINYKNISIKDGIIYIFFNLKKLEKLEKIKDVDECYNKYLNYYNELKSINNNNNIVVIPVYMDNGYIETPKTIFIK